ncbi:MAG: class I SAM-dependent DNA methyltransferase [Maritimibacter sp.]|nr:class I SAM-dependent DNA methyltransferase [Maritimibacter sp.]
MTPQEFIEKWKSSKLKESAGAQSHFNDLCRLLGIKDPSTADPKGEWFTFEKGASKTSGGNGWADVWRKDCFAWEYKGKRKNLDAAFDQLLRYSIALDHPPLLIVSDMDQIRIHTNWTNTVQQVHTITLDDLMDGAKREILHNAFLHPERLKPTKTRQVLTEDAAKRFSTIAQRLRDRGHDGHTVAHFVNRLVFCMFAEDVGLLPDKMFEKMLGHSLAHPEEFKENAQTLFAAMKSGGKVDFQRIEWFNGGLFDDDTSLPLERGDVAELQAAAALDWSDIDPSILGTLFERGLDPEKRSQLGAHYTDRDKIMQIVEPVIVRPLLAEWDGVKAEIEIALGKAEDAKSKSARTKAAKEAERLHTTFLERLKTFRVLDPACGSGNFLYLALLSLKDIEHRVNLEAEALGLPRGFPTVGPECVKGIELNPYAAELARVSVWIGEIQWMRRNGFEAAKNPILRSLGTIENRDAILNADGTETKWPEVDAIVGNPPFLGAKLMKRSLGISETEAIRAAFDGRLPGFTDLVCYWFEKGRAQIVEGRAKRVGLVATNSIAKNTNLPVMRRIVSDLTIFAAWSDEPWVVEGAAVRVAIVCFCAPNLAAGAALLNGVPVLSINPNLTTGTDLSAALPVAENRGRSMLGIQKSGPFDVYGETARRWLQLPANPNGLGNARVLRPYWNGDDLTARPRDVWFIDLPRSASEAHAALWEAPFLHLQSAPYDANDPDSLSLKQERQTARDDHARDRWWEPYWPRPEMRRSIEAIPRYIVTPETAQYRLFVWLSYPTLPDKNLIVIPRDDDTTFGILHSTFHERWALNIGSSLEDRPRYTSSTTFETFPFPEGLTPDTPSADYADDPRAQSIAAAAARLNELREVWLNPPDLVTRVPEVVPGYPDRILPKDDKAAKELKKRTLTNLYNARPAWLDHAHRALDEAVADAYGWGDDWRAGVLTDDEILSRLFRLNQERAARQNAKNNADL